MASITKLPTGIVSHRRMVMNFYKRCCRAVEATIHTKHVSRYFKTIVRSRFDENMDICDHQLAKHKLEEGERELFLNQEPFPLKFAQSPGGSCYQREVIPPDWVLDYWHPLEKAQYPEYFARREQRKKDYVKFWDENYAKLGGTCNEK